MFVFYPSSSAQVLVYDIRSPKTPTKTSIAHSHSVTSMVFKHRLDRQQVALVMRVVKTRPKLSQHKSTTSLRTVQEVTMEKIEPITEQTHETVETNGMEKEVFAKLHHPHHVPLDQHQRGVQQVPSSPAKPLNITREAG
jgi:hypothetical protein